MHVSLLDYESLLQSHLGIIHFPFVCKSRKDCYGKDGNEKWHEGTQVHKRSICCNFIRQENKVYRLKSPLVGRAFCNFSFHRNLTFARTINIVKLICHTIVASNSLKQTLDVQASNCKRLTNTSESPTPGWRDTYGEWAAPGQWRVADPPPWPPCNCAARNYEIKARIGNFNWIISLFNLIMAHWPILPVTGYSFFPPFVRQSCI